MGCATNVVLSTFLILSLSSPAADARQDQAVDDTPPISVLELSKAEEIVELLTASYAADLAVMVAIRAAGCTGAEARCAPLFFAQDVILGPWNFVKLLRVTHEVQDPEAATVFAPRDYETPPLWPPGDLPAALVSVAGYAMEQQVAFYEQLEAWQITLEKYNKAVNGNDEAAAAEQRRALDRYSSRASTAAAAVSAASLQFLEGLTPLMRHFASAIPVEDAESAKNDLRDRGFGPELRARFAALGISTAESNALQDEIFALTIDAPVDLLDGLTGVTRAYDRLADLLTVPADSIANLRPIAHAGSDLTALTSDVDLATVTLNGTGSTDPEAGPLEYLWTLDSNTASGPKPTISVPLGTHHIALTVSDKNGGTDVDIVTVAVGDQAAPLITAVKATPDVLSPPSRELVAVELEVAVTDNDDPEPFCQVVSVGVNDAAGGSSGGPAEPDIVLEGSLRILLRAERSGGATNRVYTVTVQCTDRTNHSSFGSVFVSVPR